MATRGHPKALDTAVATFGSVGLAAAHLVKVALGAIISALSASLQFVLSGQLEERGTPARESIGVQHWAWSKSRRSWFWLASEADDLEERRLSATQGKLFALETVDGMLDTTSLSGSQAQRDKSRALWRTHPNKELAIFEHMDNPRIHRHREQVTICRVRESEFRFGPRGAFSGWPRTARSNVGMCPT